MKRILLGSNSPRRKDLLNQMGYNFEVVKITCDEDFDFSMKIDRVAEYLAKKKSKAYGKLDTGEILITADTTVLINNMILNKPKNREEAIEMLSMLSGKMHQVSTGVCLRNSERKVSFNEVTDVYISKLSMQDITEYLDQCKPYDKAGAYGIQEWFGHRHVTGIKGCYYNVVGLPTSTLHQYIRDF